MNDQSDEKASPTANQDRKRPRFHAVDLYGAELADRLDWLESVVGARGRRKFENAKLNASAFSGQYVLGTTFTEEGRIVLCALVDQLKAGTVAALCDISSYYAAGKRVPLGMAIRGNRLVDVWR